MIKEKYTIKDVILISGPVFVELMLQLLVGNIDQFMVSRVSQEAVAAIGNGNLIMNLIIVLLNMMASAATVLISKYLGAKDHKKINETATVSLLVTGVSGFVCTLVLLLGAKTIFSWLQVPAEIIAEASAYLRITGAFVMVQGAYMTIAAILRSYALVKEVLVSSFIMNMINIAGNAVLINGLFGFPKLGIVGAAISTNFSKLIGLIIVATFMLKKTDARVSTSYLKPFPTGTLNRILGIALPSGGESMSYSLSQTCIMKMINFFGTAVITTKVYCSMLANVAYIYSIAVSQATQIVIGYLIGSGNTKDLDKHMRNAILASIGVSLSITAIFYFNSDAVLGIFTSNPMVLELGKKILLVEFVLEVGRSINIAMVRGLITVGDVLFPVGICVVSAWIIAVGAGYVLGVHMGYGLLGIWWAMAIDECVRGALFIHRWKKGKWRKTHMPACS
ncbi:MAG: MATE family efflux transporter [Oscillospiraceae bacterium]|nr:MATE family efflux transporter [Oscillospiraceae bacterium]